MTALLVGVAGMAGCLSRYGISNQFHGSALPWATVGINVLGSLLLGMLDSSGLTDPSTRAILGVGFLGGFTTFSSLALETVTLLQRRAYLSATGYVAATVVVGVAACAAGLWLGEALRRFVAAGRPVIGICNGFQVLTRAGLLPGALGHNVGGHFDCRWVELAAPASRSIWTAGLAGSGDLVHCPIAHGEGRYVHPDPAALAAAGQVALTYASTNPNGSVADIAGVCDETGVVLGLMPHPEDHVVVRQHPRAHRGGGGAAHLGLRLFEAGVRHAREL